MNSSVSHSPAESAAAIRVNASDDVAIALRNFAAGEAVQIGDALVVLRNDIPRGHKFAVHAIAAHAPVHKYGWPIGVTQTAITAGEHVHSHNLVTQLRGAGEYRYQPSNAAPGDIASEPSHSFMGYRRADGSIGTRNEIWVLCTVGCVGRTAQRIAQAATQRYVLERKQIDGIHAFTHPFGCSQLGGDRPANRRVTNSTKSVIAIWKDGVTL